MLRFRSAFMEKGEIIVFSTSCMCRVRVCGRAQSTLLAGRLGQAWEAGQARQAGQAGQAGDACVWPCTEHTVFEAGGRKSYVFVILAC